MKEKFNTRTVGLEFTCCKKRVLTKFAEMLVWLSNFLLDNTIPRCVCKSSPWLQILCLYRSQKEPNLFQHVIIHTWTKQTGYQILSTDNKWLSIHLFLENSDWLNEIEWIKYLRMLWSRKKKLMSSVKLPPGKCLLSFSQHLLSIAVKSLLQENTEMTPQSYNAFFKSGREYFQLLSKTQLYSA